MTDDRLRRALEAFAVPAGPCPAQETLAGLAAGTLPPGEADAVRRHAAGCAACLEAWRDMRTLVARTNSPDSEPAEAPPEHAISPRASRLMRIALAAAAALALAGLGAALLAVVHLRRENLNLSLDLARAAEARKIPSEAALVELVPEDFALRGDAEAPLPVAMSGKPLALVLSILDPLPETVEATLRSGDGAALWSGPWSPLPGGPPTLLVPEGLLGPGRYVLEIRRPGGQELIHRFPFEAR